MTGDELRKAFLTFFESKGHTVVPSSSLIPQGDPTLLLTTAGMVQMKPYFLGLAVPSNTKLTSCQKCFRTTDADSVGDNRHLTFFEMLGNFSVGDYFKKEAIEWGWEFVTEWLKFPHDRLWITIFLDDDEAMVHWRRMGVPTERIVRLGEKQNFWGPAGDSGPCGPCSEIHYDFGPEFGCGQSGCSPECECGRFSEIWNLVFMQFNQDVQGQRTPLPKPNIDTGMGLERVAAIMQEKRTVYETDIFAPLVAKVAGMTGKHFGKDEGVDRSIRVIAEHARGITFLIADGVVPGNEGRGYVLRRLLRRTALFGRKLGLEEPFIGVLADFVVERMGHVYPELRQNQEMVRSIVNLEEKRFGEALNSGLNALDKVMEAAGSDKRIRGEDAFMLYDTYGFPKELTVEVASERGFAVDVDGFEREMERQRERARAAHKFGGGDKTELKAYEQLGITASGFVGYETCCHESVVMGLIAGGKPVDSVSEGDEVEVVLKDSPFYGEMGGQVGDTGEIRSAQGRISVRQTIRPLPDLIVHQGKVVQGHIAVSDSVVAEVDIKRRLDIARNHTATHLLQSALRAVLGQHVRQSGSLVTPDRFRFDFNHLEAVGKQRLLEVQQLVNEKIRENLPVMASVTSYKEAVARGATALFGEKYGDEVRVLQVGDPPFSVELCGGTHVHSTGEIGLLHIVSEESVGSGLRRIEAMTGRAAERLVEERLSELDSLAAQLQTMPERVQAKVASMADELERERKRALAVERETARRAAGSLLSEARDVNGIQVISTKVTATSADAMREMGDRLKEELKSGVIVLGGVCDGKPSLLAMVTPDLVAKGFNAGQVVKELAKVVGGGGGGRAELGQGSGKDAGKLDEALKQVDRLVEVHYDRASGTWKK
ncbi:MAG: alanine--tRNA ligase [Dehalococcoidia bacterium]|nr:alanine--tRNA ligase [Dehalococcoidia bacterium]